MTRLQERALACLPVPEVDVETMYADAAGIEHPVIRRDVRRLLESHERLRAELAGAVAMLDAAPDLLASAEAVLAGGYYLGPDRDRLAAAVLKAKGA